MTPEQTRNFWILEGYPLMPEWIEFCREYARCSTIPCSVIAIPVSRWWSCVAMEYKIAPQQRAYFGLERNPVTGDDDLVFIIEGVVTYNWNLGE